MISALFLFLLPSGDKEKKGALLEWKDAQENVPWGLLVLFGGGLSLANAVQATGLAVWMGSLIPQGINLALIIILVVALIIFLTELTSNMATTATFLPVVAAIAIQSNFDPFGNSCSSFSSQLCFYATCRHTAKCNSFWLWTYKSSANGSSGFSYKYSRNYRCIFGRCIFSSLLPTLVPFGHSSRPSGISNPV